MEKTQLCFGQVSPGVVVARGVFFTTGIVLRRQVRMVGLRSGLEMAYESRQMEPTALVSCCWLQRVPLRLTESSAHRG